MPGWQQTHRFTGYPVMPGGTDIIGGAPVAPGGTAAPWGVLPVANPTTTILGIAHASAQVGFAVTVNDMPDIKIAKNGTGATVTAGTYIGVPSSVTITGASGNVIEPIIGPVTVVAKRGTWALGIALEDGAPGQNFSYILKPTQLSGLE